MKHRILIVLAALLGLVAAPALAQPALLHAGFSAKKITPVGPAPPGWSFVPQPITGVWGEAFEDEDGDGCYDIEVIEPEIPEEPPPPPSAEDHTDDPANTLIDPLSAGKWDGIWTNAGFGGKCALGAYDDIWARAVVLSQGGKTVAMVSVDVVGFFQEEIDRVRETLTLLHPQVQLDAVVVAATHGHEGPDTMGLWHGVLGLDGKYPLFQQYIRHQIVQAIVEAHGTREAAYVKFARGTEARAQRDSRPPVVFDTDVWAAEFVRPLDGSTVGTLVNWSNHPEALWDPNEFISSDYPHAVRERMESQRGGTSIFFVGSVGGLMTPGRTTTVPGYPVDDFSYDRMLVLGGLVADAAIAALATAPLATTTDLSVAHKDFVVPMDNQSLFALNSAGVFDKELAVAENGQVGVLTEMHVVTLGPAVFITVPGELFPEIAGDIDPATIGYGRADCPMADTGRPHEPVIRDQFPNATYKFLFGLGGDELGYIVPGYDFWGVGVPPPDELVPIPDPVPDPDPRPTIFVGIEQRVDPCGERHYEETVSAGSVLAPVVACTAAELAGKDPFGTWDTDPEFAACSPENTTSIVGVSP